MDNKNEQVQKEMVEEIEKKLDAFMFCEQGALLSFCTEPY